MSERFVIRNGRVLTPFRELNNGGVVVEGGIVTDVFQEHPNLVLSNHREIDAQGLYVSPGFIDMHVHGGGNAEVADGTVDSVATMCKTHSRFGTTAIVPTVSTSPWEVVYRSIDAVREAQASDDTGAEILGIHLEGPYFSHAQKGAQNPDYLQLPDPKDYLNVLDYWDGIIMMGAAPELPGALELGRELRGRGILSCIAHSDATYLDVLNALECGYTHITHFYSGCSIVHRENAYRVSGIVESGYLMDDLTVEIIADGKHLPPSLLKLIYKVKGSDRIALITDSTSFSGMQIPENQYVKSRDGRDLILEDDVMKLSDRSSFAGSIATTNKLVRNMVNLADVPLLEAVKMASYTPAKILKVSHRKGSLSIGKDADLLIFDRTLDVKMTMVEGNIVHDVRQ